MLNGRGQTESNRVRFAAVASVVAIICMVAGCAGGSQRETAVRVGNATITRGTVTHWMSVRHVVPLAGASTKQQALGFLISIAWVTGEAADRGMKVSDSEVKAALAAREHAYSSHAQFQEALRALGYTLPDVKLELAAKLAATKLKQSLANGEPKVTTREIKSYYTKHIRDFHIPEERYFDIVEYPKTLDEAREFIREAAAGRSVTGAASLHESYRRKPFSDYGGEKRIIYEAIFTARPHVLSEPIPEYRHYWLFEVKRIVSAHVRSFARARGSIARKLTDERRRRTLERFVERWRKKWLARTDCEPGFVVQKCKQFRGHQTHENPLAFE